MQFPSKYHFLCYGPMPFPLGLKLPNIIKVVSSSGHFMQFPATKHFFSELDPNLLCRWRNRKHILCSSGYSTEFPSCTSSLIPPFIPATSSIRVVVLSNTSVRCSSGYFMQFLRKKICNHPLTLQPEGWVVLINMVFPLDLDISFNS